MTAWRRWLVALAVCLPLVVGLGAYLKSGVEAVPTGFGELLAFELTPGETLRLRVPGQVPKVTLTAWAAVLRDEDRSDRTVSVTLHARLLDGERVLFEQDYAATSLLSTATRTHLADEDALVSESRDYVVAPPSPPARAATLELTIARTTADLVLLRGTFPQPRGSTETSLAERGLSEDQRRAFLVGRSTLGWADMTAAQRALVLHDWSRRLDAIGHLNQDFRVRRLVTSREDVLHQFAHREPPALPSGPRRALALNFAGPLRAVVHGPPGAALRVTSTASAAAEDLRFDGTGVAQLSSPDARARTLTLTLPEGDGAIRIAATPADAARQIGDLEPVPAGQGMAAIGPDTHAVRAARLHPTEPVRYRIAHGQSVVHLALWRARPPGEPPSTNVTVSATLHAQGRAPVVHRATLPLREQLFDRLGDRELSAPAWTSLATSGLEAIDLVGDGDTLAQVFAEDGNVEEEIALRPYRIALAESERWVHAPRELSRRVAMRPERWDELSTLGRFPTITTQTRIEGDGAADAHAGARPDRALLPARPTRERVVFERAPGGVSRDGEWALLDGPTSLAVSSTGPAAGRVDVHYGVATSELGRELVLRVGGVDVARERMVMSTGSLRVTVPPGVHSFELAGAAVGFAAASAKPTAGGALARRGYHEVAAGTDLSFTVDLPPRESRVVILFATALRPSRAWRAVATVDDGRAARGAVGFFRRPSEISAIIDGAGPRDRTAVTWDSEAEEKAVADVHRGKLVLGDDLVVGRHEVKLHAEGVPLWVRAVLIGEGPELEAGSHHLYTAEAQ